MKDKVIIFRCKYCGINECLFNAKRTKKQDKLLQKYNCCEECYIYDMCNIIKEINKKQKELFKIW